MNLYLFWDGVHKSYVAGEDLQNAQDKYFSHYPQGSWDRIDLIAPSITSRLIVEKKGD